MIILGVAQSAGPADELEAGRWLRGVVLRSAAAKAMPLLLLGSYTPTGASRELLLLCFTRYTPPTQQ